MADEQVFSVAGKVIAVTGGSSGLGLHMVRVLARHGAKVVSISRSRDGEKFCPSGGEVLEIMADITNPDEVKTAFDEAEQRLGPINVLFNNAGVAHVARALDTTRDMLEHIFDVNVAGSFFTAQEMARRMIDRKQAGAIVNTTSILAERPQKGTAAYAMSKACVTQMTRALALEWASHDIRVNAIAPGWFPTRINERQLSGPAGGYFKGRNPMRRLGEMEDLDGVVLMLASDASRYMTGSVITIDGGHHI
ncbi:MULTISPECIES: SDR family NAD(P)-dependent oxidoreductase [Brucella]|jgi:NAD(P)-dependent dehydrogenase (short-subunit alcohol dehydrogenase family)|uniref:NADH(P)-binding family protein n=2 Tax=Brucella TaxID=234 RepID=A0A1A9FMB8_9HYPH|nr:MULTISPECIES: SDR family oxidoreductase [Brucella]EMG53852.1 short-chain dehydrogenase/reductase SDR [Ochrobactrum sp. CDB2]MBK0023585.1 SDR family oxidoreductase [Ochrobactrum sp. S45]MBK0045620.1 SDR family oxidoreductase [Ochrobactrum sp. S46]MBO1023157.1 SDR family oxidoreductase [Ochrobactrum sp. SD129]MQP39400.1 SDR family oxidoreductase [Ochrobactrum sp. MYb237]QWK77128.1 SDR family oxidoreductase [Ochrobactrum sp. BTU1]